MARIRPITGGVLSPFTLLCCLLLTWPMTGSAQHLDWLDKFGTDRAGSAWAIAMDATGVYVTGRTETALPGQTQGDDYDGFLRKYSLDGQVLWTRQFEVVGPGMHSRDEPFAAAANGSGVYVAGRMQCMQRECPPAAFVIRFDADGNRQWTHLSQDLYSFVTMTVNDSGVYLSGAGLSSLDSKMLARLGLDGNPVWAVEVNASSRGIVDLAAYDNRLYAVGDLGNVDVRVYDLAGNEVDSLGDGDFSGDSVNVDDSGVYVGGGPFRTYWEWELKKFSHGGSVLWEHALVVQPVDLELDDGGLLVLMEDESTPYVARFTLDGEFTWQFRFGDPANRELLPAVGSVARDGEVYIAGDALGEGDGQAFVANVSPRRTPELGAWAVSGNSVLAVMHHKRWHEGPSLWVRDAVTRQFRNRKYHPGYYQPRDFVLLPDITGNNQPESVILAVHETSGEVVALITDGLSGAPINELTFDKTYIPWQLDLVPDPGGGLGPRLALLGVSKTDRTVVSQVRHPTGGAPDLTVSFGRWDHSRSNYALIEQIVLGSAGPAGNPAVALLGVPPSFMEASIMAEVSIRDAITNQPITDFGVGPFHTAVDADTLPDLNGNGSDELVMLEYGPLHGGMRTTIYDGSTGDALKHVYFTQAGTPREVLVIPDMNGNGYPELGMLKEDAGATPGIDRLEIKDPSSGVWLSEIGLWRKDRRHLGLAVVPDVNGNGIAEVGQLQEHESNGSLSVLVKDALTGKRVSRVWF